MSSQSTYKSLTKRCCFSARCSKYNFLFIHYKKGNLLISNLIFLTITTNQYQEAQSKTPAAITAVPQIKVNATE